MNPDRSRGHSTNDRLRRELGVSGPSGIPSGKAPCVGATDVFFKSDRYETPDDRAEREGLARAICDGCQWRAPCGDYALATQEKYGTWGGLTEEDRGQRRVRPSRARSAAS